MRETWIHDTDSVRLLLWIAVAIDNMLILFLSIDNVDCIKIDAKLANKIHNRNNMKQVF